MSYLSNRRFAKLVLHRLTCEPACTERCLKVVAVDRTIEIENFASEVRDSSKLALHRLGIDFAQVDVTDSDLGFLESLRATNGNRHTLERLQ